MIKKVISGGQTGADLGGLKAAREMDIETGGWVPHGWRTENGPLPALSVFNMREHASREYPPRTKQNVLDADVTLVFARRLDGGSKLTYELCKANKKPVLHVTEKTKIGEVVAWLLDHDKGELIVNVAGNRESKVPGTEEATRMFLKQVFKELM